MPGKPDRSNSSLDSRGNYEAQGGFNPNKDCSRGGGGGGGGGGSGGGGGGGASSSGKSMDK